MSSNASSSIKVGSQLKIPGHYKLTLSFQTDSRGEGVNLTLAVARRLNQERVDTDEREVHRQGSALATHLARKVHRLVGGSRNHSLSDLLVAMASHPQARGASDAGVSYGDGLGSSSVVYVGHSFGSSCKSPRVFDNCAIFTVNDSESILKPAKMSAVSVCPINHYHSSAEVGGASGEDQHAQARTWGTVWTDGS